MIAKHDGRNFGMFKTSHRKEKFFMEEFSAFALEVREGKASLKQVVSLRIYGTSTNGSNTACIWVHTRDGQCKSGSGHAGGFGYHRPSAAAQEAIYGAGYELSEDIDGRGDSAIESAVKAISAAAGYPDCFIHVAHP